MTLRSSDLQSDSDLDSIRNSCDVLNLEHDYSNEQSNLDNKNKSVIFKIYFMSTTQNILTGIGTFTVTLKNCIFRDGRSVSEIKA